MQSAHLLWLILECLRKQKGKGHKLAKSVIICQGIFPRKCRFYKSSIISKVHRAIFEIFLIPNSYGLLAIVFAGIFYEVEVSDSKFKWDTVLVERRNDILYPF